MSTFPLQVASIARHLFVGYYSNRLILSVETLIVHYEIVITRLLSNKYETNQNTILGQFKRVQIRLKIEISNSLVKPVINNRNVNKLHFESLVEEMRRTLLIK